jgi:hypothetical protein
MNSHLLYCLNQVYKTETSMNRDNMDNTAIDKHCYVLDFKEGLTTYTLIRGGQITVRPDLPDKTVRPEHPPIHP